jgi:hypothetical protein
LRPLLEPTTIMRTMKHLYPLAAILFCLSAAAVHAADAPVSAATAPASLGTLPNFRLLDHNGRSHTAHRYVDAHALVFMAVPPKGTDNATRLAEFARLAEEFTPRGIYFFAITPSASPGNLPGMAGQAPVLLDDAHIVLPVLGLDRAYECLLASTRDWEVIFRGDLLGQHEGARGLADAVRAFHKGALEPFATAARGEVLPLNPMPQELSYTRDIVPILQSRCVTCHSDGNIGPFAMTSHRKIAGWAPMMAESIRAGFMPPWQADPAFGHFSNSLAITTEEKRTLLAWLDGGAPNNAPDNDPLATAPRPAPREWKLGQPDLVISLPEPQRIPAEGEMEYRYYEVPLDLPEGTWLRGTEMRTDQPQVNHHMLVYLHQPGKSIDFTEEYIASYVPGHAPGFFPPDTGKPVPRGAGLLFQLHYTPNGKAVVDRPELGLYFHKTPPPHEVFLGSAVNRHFEIPPYATEHEASATFTAPDDIVVYSLSPHMHFRGRRMYFEAEYPNGQREVLLSVPDYDFQWQHSYHLAEPRTLPRGTRVHVAGAFDNSIRNPLNPDPARRLYWGDQSDDEMFIGSILYRHASR